MPNYSYRAVDPEAACESCAEHFDAFQRLSDPPIATCPSCEGAVRRLIVRSHALPKGQNTKKKMMSDGNLKRLGFKKLVKESDGKYVDVLQD